MITSSVVKWIGSKRLLAGHIISIMPPHTTYCETMAGGAYVFFKKERVDVEIINDKDDLLINFLEVVKDSPKKLIDAFELEIVSRTKFKKYKELLNNSEIKDPVLKALYFYYINQCSYAGANRNFGVSKKRKAPDLQKLKKIGYEVAERLNGVYVENLDYRICLDRFDSESTLFYIDPPYDVACSRAYLYGRWKKKDYEELKSHLTNIKSKFILSLNDSDCFRNLFNYFNINIVNTKYTVGQKIKNKCELLITNY